MFKTQFYDLPFTIKFSLIQYTHLQLDNVFALIVFEFSLDIYESIKNNGIINKYEKFIKQNITIYII